MIEVPVKQADYSLQLGRRGENGVRALVFDFADWVAELGPGIAQIVARRAGEETAYPVNSEQQGSTLRWIVSAADTACPGYGEAQLTYRVGGQVAKTRKYNTYTADSITWPEDVPGPEQSFLNQMLKAGAEAKAGALRSEQAASRSEQILTETAALKDQTGAACKAAETAKDEAARQAQAAANQRQAAEGAAQSAQNSERGAADEARKAAEERIAAASAQEAACSSAREAKEAKTGAELAKSGADTAAKAAQSEAEKAKLEAGRAEQAANRAEGVICDDSIETQKTWSSLNILKQTADRLASPFCKKASIVQGELVADYPMSVKTYMEPVQEGEGEPSPQNLRPIHGATELKLVRCGTNLLKTEAQSETKNGVQFTVNPDGTIAINAPETHGRTAFFLSRNTGLQYTKGMRLGKIAENDAYNTQFVEMVLIKKNGDKKYFTSFGIGQDSGEEGDTISSVYIVIPENSKVDCAFAPSIFIQGTQPETYSGEAFAQTLPQEVLGGVYEWGTGRLVQEYIELDTERYLGVGYRSASADQSLVRLYNTIVIPNSKIYCNVLPVFEREDAFMGTKPGIYSTEKGNLDMLVKKSDLLANGAEESKKETYAPAFEKWFRGIGGKIVYKAKEPKTVQLAPKQILSALGITTVYSSTGATEVTARKDPGAERREMQKRLAALEAAHTPTL